AAGFALASLGYAFIRPGVTAGASLAASDARQGEVAGVIASSGIAGVIFAPVIALSIYQYWRDGPYLINALALVAILVFVRAKAPLRNAGAQA
ncbi:MAG: MFS transporter, partial [Phenylobacterium sp.]|nr:MFS transporter [Phenylobacterium sp.]